ncbi:hypothetical protein GOODEAATRI_010823 [Goodea atripinnis]|uniref:SANT and BTB domain-containing protein n=1 Tax=Goodea atripinnis TaxID=208336 RepID=A0ABV0P3C5_9TELE
MSRFCSDNNNFPYDNNVLVLDMVLGSLWGVPQPINWDNVAKLVPGFTPKEVTACARRFEELKATVGFPRVDYQCNDLTEDSGSPSDSLCALLEAGDLVKRDGSSQSCSKVTEPSNVISILISSEFLKMDTLVEECIQYCHKHMSAIVATPCNMNCINSNLATRIAELFNHNEADDIRDKKDKFKRCGLCLKLLTKDTERKISCIPGKINVDVRGQIIFMHTRCYSSVFVCAELTHCKYHPDSVLYPGMGAEKGWHGAGIYPCCNQRVLRFDPTGIPKGCKMRDHIVNVPDEEKCDDVTAAWIRVLNDLLLHRDAVCLSKTSPAERSVQLIKTLDPLLFQRQQSLLSEDEEYTTGSEVTEDEVGDEEELSKKQARCVFVQLWLFLNKQDAPPRVPLCSYGTPTASSCTHRDLTDIRNCCWTLIMLVGAVNSVLSSQVLLKLGLSGP